MKELLQEYGWLIIAVVVIVGLIVIVNLAKAKVQTSAESTVDSLNTTASKGLNKADTIMNNLD